MSFKAFPFAVLILGHRQELLFTYLWENDEGRKLHEGTKTYLVTIHKYFHLKSLFYNDIIMRLHNASICLSINSGLY